ncbi:hypothetical protein GCM10010273_45330 [Streptomyces lavendulocolor]
MCTSAYPALLVILLTCENTLLTLLSQPACGVARRRAYAATALLPSSEAADASSGSFRPPTGTETLRKDAARARPVAAATGERTAAERAPCTPPEPRVNGRYGRIGGASHSVSRRPR